MKVYKCLIAQSAVLLAALLEPVVAFSQGGGGITCLAPTPTTERVTLLVRHSQTTTVPNCPTGWTKMWDGYSFLTSGGGGTAESGGQDLGSPGSCLREFRPMPYMECYGSGTGVCDYNTAYDYAYWLSTVVSDGPTLPSDQAINQASRCSVCEGTKTVLAVHSQTASVPACPTGWSSLWEGYSFLTSWGGTSGDSGGQSLGSTGSCLPVFRSMPYMECWGAGTGSCDQATGNDFAYWLSNRTVDEGAVSGPEEGAARASRCNVCQKN